MYISVRAHAKAKTVKIENRDNVLHVYVKKPALAGQANQAIIKELARFLKTKKNKIILKRGLKTKNKIFEIID